MHALTVVVKVQLIVSHVPIVVRVIVEVAAVVIAINGAEMIVPKGVQQRAQNTVRKVAVVVVVAMQEAEPQTL